MKPFTWTFSKLKNYEWPCPRKHYEVDICKNFSDSSDALTEGIYGHEALAGRLQGKKILPEDLAYCENAVVFVEGIVVGSRGTLLVEQQLGLDRQLKASTWFSPLAWLRMKQDVVIVADTKAWAFDWKFGKNQTEDSIQLALAAACIFAKYPAVQQVVTGYIWLNFVDPKTLRYPPPNLVKWTRSDMDEFWGEVLPRVEQYEEAYDAVRKDPSMLEAHFPIKPGNPGRKNHCNWCVVKTCQHNTNTRLQS